MTATLETTQIELKHLRTRVAEMQQTLEAIRRGEVDALVAEGPEGPRIYTLQTPDQPYRELIEQMSEGAASISEHGTLLFCNKRLAEMLRQPHEKLIGAPVCGFIASSQRAAFTELLDRSVKTEVKGETEFQRADGTLMPVQVSLRWADTGSICMVATDVTRLRTLLDRVNDTLQIIDLETLHIVDMNERGCTQLGYSRDELLTMSLPDIDGDLDVVQLQKLKTQIRGEGSLVFETRYRRKDGTLFPVEVSVDTFSADRRHILAIARDITEPRRAQQALEESEVRFRALIEDALDPVAIIERDGTIRYTSPATREMSGYDPAELLGLRFFDFLHPDDAEKVARQLVSIVDTPGAVQRMVARIRRKDGAWRLAEASVRNQLGVAPIDGLVVTLRDVTAIERTARALRAMSAVDATLVRATSEQELAEHACRVMVEIGGYRTAWIGAPRNDASQSIRVIAQTGEAEGFLDHAPITWGDGAPGPSGMALRTGETQVARDYPGRLADPEWQEAARGREYVACIAIPLAGKNSLWGVLTLYADNPEAFDHEEVKLLEQMAADVSYGIEAMRDRQQHALVLERLENNMEATVHALSATMERRDPYTAGHQMRVARLCRAIAGELGLSSDQTRGLELAALIHDVGKIEVPAEVLSKPGRLTDLEFALIKLHPQAGYQIVRNIDFPWPVATMVLQHHERMDGSGYPGGLRGEEILLESRILQVADVVEAISSHRPYRAALGIEQALAEVTRGSGTGFDRKVVEACRKVLLESNFSF